MKKEVDELIVLALKGKGWMSQAEIKLCIHQEFNESTFFRQIKSLLDRRTVEWTFQRNIYKFGYHKKGTDRCYRIKQ